MIIDFRTDSINSTQSARTTVDSRQVFNFDALIQKHTEEEQKFLDSLAKEWKRIPSELLDYTTAQNFVCYAKLTE